MNAFNQLAGGGKLSRVVREHGGRIVRDVIRTWGGDLAAEGILHTSVCRYLRAHGVL